MTITVEADLASPAFKANPFPYYAHLRAHTPVVRVRLPDKQHAWLITRYDDAVAAFKDPRFAKDKLSALTAGQARKQPWMPKFFLPLTRNMLDLDAPDHTRLRSLVQRAFTPKLVENLRARVESLTHDLLDLVAKAGKFDLIRDYALPVPTTIIAEMLGVPAKDRHRFHRWSSAIVSSNASQFGMLLAIPNVVAFMRYIRQLIRAKRRTPGDDLLTSLVTAEEAGDQLNEDELVAMIFLLLVAGHETTVNLIGNGTLALLEHPEQMAKLRNEGALMKSAVEELLRFSPPLETATERYAREDVTYTGVTIPRGAMVYVVIASANRDEAQFERPDELMVTREPNRHLSFGQGIHYCLGAPLARMEGQIAMANLLQRFPELRIAGRREALKWKKGLVLRGLERLPVLSG